MSAVLLAGCGSTDQSGWEMARKKSPAERPEAFLDLPIVLPGAASKVAPLATTTPIGAVSQRTLDEGSLFRRGYSAPTP